MAAALEYLKLPRIVYEHCTSMNRTKTAVQFVQQTLMVKRVGIYSATKMFYRLGQGVSLSCFVKILQLHQ